MKRKSCILVLCVREFFFKLWDLKLHLNVHTKEKPYSCKICETSLRSSTSLVLHMRSHSGEKRFHCEICGKDFSQRSNMRSHKKTHLS